jgi:integrase
MVFRRKYRASNGDVRECKKYSIRYPRDGQMLEESTGTTSRREAERLLKLREGDVERGLPVSPKMGRLRFREAVLDVIADYELKGNKTTGEVQRRLRLHLLPVFAERRLVAITTADLRAYAVQRKSMGAAAATIRLELSIVKRMFKLAVQSAKILSMPHVPMPHVANAREGFFETAQVQSVIAHLPDELKAVIRVAFVTGWRIASELLTLQWSQVNLDTREIRLEAGTTNNGEGRLFVMTPELHAVLEGQWRAHVALRAQGRLVPWVFHRDGQPIRSFRKAWKLATRAAGCPGRIPHDLRRTAVRNLVRAGVAERVAMRMTGHKTRSIFDRYHIVSQGDHHEAACKLAAVTDAVIAAGQRGPTVATGSQAVIA